MNRRFVLAASAVTSALALVPTARAGAATVETSRAERLAEPGWWQSTPALWIALGLLFVGLAIGISLVLAPRLARSQLAGSRITGLRRGSGTLTSISRHATTFAERSLSKNDRSSRLNLALERAGIDMRPSEALVLAATASFAGFAVALLLNGLVLGILVGVTVPLLARGMLSTMAQRRRVKFADQLEQTLPLMAGNLRAGFGVVQAFDSVARESEAPTSDEFRRLVVELRLGRDQADALESMARRLDSEDFEWVVQAIEIHREIGGDLAQILDNVYATIRDRNRIRRQISSLSAEGKLSAAILFVLPLGMFGVISLLNPSYVGELTGSGLGTALLIGAGALLTIGGLWLKRIVRLVF